MDPVKRAVELFGDIAFDLEVEDVAFQADRPQRSAKAGRVWKVSRRRFPVESSANRQVSAIRQGD